LLGLPAAGDNAAMPTEPPNAEAPKRKRRWFQFSLRSLLIVVTLLAVVCGFAAVVIENRKLMRERDESRATVDRLWDHITELMKKK
jgi:hypothetical protein